MAIDGSFLDLTATHLDTFKHPDPKKKDLRVVDVSSVPSPRMTADAQSYEILPDEETWGNMYFVIKYPERPSSAFVAVSHQLGA
jgi:RNA polymerase II-associated factor 1